MPSTFSSIHSHILMAMTNSESVQCTVMIEETLFVRAHLAVNFRDSFAEEIAYFVIATGIFHLQKNSIVCELFLSVQRPKSISFSLSWSFRSLLWCIYDIINQKHFIWTEIKKYRSVEVHLLCHRALPPLAILHPNRQRYLHAMHNLIVPKHCWAAPTKSGPILSSTSSFCWKKNEKKVI